MKIAVTGSDGFIGKRLSEALEESGHKVIRYDLSNLDIREEVEIEKGLDAVFHMAALNKPYLSKEDPIQTFKPNVLGVLHVLDAMRKSGAKKIIFPSSVFVYKDLTKTKETDKVGYNGLYPYGLEKIIGEEYIKIYAELFGIDYSILRITGVYGPGMYKNPIFDVIDGFSKDEVNLFVNRNSIYNFVYIDDVVSALVESLNWNNCTLNVAADNNTKVEEIYDFFSKKLKMEKPIKDNDRLIKIMGNNEEIRKKGWKIKYPLEDGLTETYNYLKDKN